MSTVGKGNLEKKQKEFKQKTQQSSIRPSGDDLEVLQLAEDASTMGKMFETMGREMKATEVSNDILSMFKKDGEYIVLRVDSPMMRSAPLVPKPSQ
jgi:hypothetical protein